MRCSTYTPFCFRSLVTVCLVFVSLLATVQGGTVSITSGPVSSLSANLSGPLSEPFSFTTLSPSAVKVHGTGNYLSTLDSAHETITMDVSGLLTADAGEAFTLDYEFNLSLTGAGSVSWTISSTIGGLPGPVESGGPITSSDSGFFEGIKSVNAPFAVSNAPWTATLTVNWSNVTAGDTLEVEIPTDSIDFVVVPEPSSFLLVGFAGMAFLRRRR